MNSTMDSPYPQVPKRTYLCRSSSTIASFATALSSFTPPTEDDIPLSELSIPDVPKVTTPDPSLTPQLSSPPSETHDNTQDSVPNSFVIRASGFNADDFEFGPKIFEAFLRGDNAVQRAINFAVIALYSYALIWFVDLRDSWRKLKLEDHDSRDHWFIFLTLVNACLLIMTVYKAICNVSLVVTDHV